MGCCSVEPRACARRWQSPLSSHSAAHGLVDVRRKALRLGKFLSNVKAARAVDWTASSAPAQLLAAAGEGTYYFLDQFVWCARVARARKRSRRAGSAWEALGGAAARCEGSVLCDACEGPVARRLVKSGVLDARLDARLSKASAWAELVGYCGSVTLNATALVRLRKQADVLQLELLLAQGNPAVVRSRWSLALHAQPVARQLGQVVSSAWRTATAQVSRPSLTSPRKQALHSHASADNIADACALAGRSRDVQQGAGEITARAPDATARDDPAARSAGVPGRRRLADRAARDHRCKALGGGTVRDMVSAQPARPKQLGVCAGLQRVHDVRVRMSAAAGPLSLGGMPPCHHPRASCLNPYACRWARAVCQRNGACAVRHRVRQHQCMEELACVRRWRPLSRACGCGCLLLL